MSISKSDPFPLTPFEFGKLPFFAGAVPIKPMLNDDLNENCKQDSKWQNIDKTFDNFIHLQE